MPPVVRTLLIGHGYLGAALARRLAAAGFPAEAAARSGDENAPVPVHAADVSSTESLLRLRDALSFGAPGAVVHCASSGRGGAEAYREVFARGAEALSRVFPGTPLLFTSSTSVYGQTDGSVVAEGSEASPSRETGRILREAEDIVRGGGGTVFRLAGIYGPGRSVHLKRILEGTARIESGEPSRYLNQIHRDDAVDAALLFLERVAEGAAGRPAAPGSLGAPGGLFNVVDDTPLAQRRCYEELAALLELPAPPESPPDRDRKRAWTHKRVSNAALRAQGWRPRHPSFLDALRTDPRLLPSIREQLRDS